MRKTKHPVIDGHRVCSRCGENKPVSDFPKNKNSKYGIHSYCKDCSNEMSRAYFQKHKEECKEYRRKLYHSKKREGTFLNKIAYERHKEAFKERSRDSYYNTGYLPKRYLKRYTASLVKAQEKKKKLLEEIVPDWKMTARQRLRLHTYEDAIESWKRKIAEAEKTIADYTNERSCPEEEKQEQETTTVNNMEEQKPTSAHMTKAALINLLSDVPNDARIIYVGDSENRSSLVAAWRSDPHSVCIRNLNATMPYIITDGALYELVSASIPFPECPKKGE